MTRTATSYTDQGRAAHVPVMAGAVDVSTPTAGYFRHRLRSSAVYVGIRIWFGAPLDPVTGEELDRGWRWQAQINGRPADIDSVWPECGRMAITEADYRRYCAQEGWARQAAPESAYAEPVRKIDRLSTSHPMPF